MWNPRLEPSDKHFRLLPDSSLHPLTQLGVVTLDALRLNRLPLVAHRLRKRLALDEQRMLRLEERLRSLEDLQHQYAKLVEEQFEILRKQQELLRLLMTRDVE